MRIQTSETLATPDAEMVLRVLEWSLRDISIEVVRDGRRIMVRGLGPSQRTMNRNDIAVVEVACENDHTVIRADINYLSSALLGGVPQDELVRSKLDRVLDRVEMEVGAKRVRVEASPWLAEPIREAEPGFESEHTLESEPEHTWESKQTVEREFAIEPGESIEHQYAVHGGHDVRPEAGGELEHFVETEPVQVAEPVIETEPVREPEPEVVAVPSASVALPVAVPSRHEELLEIPMFQTFQSESKKTPKRWGLLATVACMLAAVGLFLGWPYVAGLVHERLNPSQNVEESAPAESPETTKLAADKAPMQVPDANDVAVRSASIHNESDPRVWLESWADAMRGQDAGAQASFYADPVQHYALKSNVSNADVWLDKKNAIQNRPHGWSVALENVEVEPRPDESMRVRLTKHFTFQSDGGRVSEQFIPSQLKLSKIDGQWKITSEQNLRR